MTYSNNTTILSVVKKIIRLILIISIISEMIFFPSWENFCGCIMTFICWYIFDHFFLLRAIILKYPFAFIMYTSMFFYRFLPLPATLLENKPITYGLQIPYMTFLFETLLFIVSSFAFRFSFSLNRKNNKLQKILLRIGFFKPLPSTVIWVLGCIGLLARLSSFAVGNVEYGDIGNKFTSGLIFLMYTPFCLFFPSLYTYQSQKLKNSKHNKALWAYFTIVTLLGIASNSRENMIIAIGTFILIGLLYQIKRNIHFSQISPAKILFMGIITYIGINILSDFSTAMLYNRSIRSDVNKKELLNRTLETYKNKELMNKLNQINQLEKAQPLLSYKYGWDETYVDNFMLNRYCNIRITDQTLYYALNTTDDNNRMKKNFIDNLISLLPTPILERLDIDLNKQDIRHSRGDLLYAIGTHSNIFSGFRVTSHVADGLMTFGLLYFPIQFIIFLCIFKLQNALVFYTRKKYIYSIFGLICFFTFFGLFRNANGCSGDTMYLLRGFWQSLILFGSLSYIIRKIHIKLHQSKALH